MSSTLAKLLSITSVVPDVVKLCVQLGNDVESKGMTLGDRSYDFYGCVEGEERRGERERERGGPVDI